MSIHTRAFKIAILTLWTICYSVVVYSQTSLKLAKNEVDFGKISFIAYPAKTIEFTNTGNKKLAILLIEKGPNVRVNFEHRFYQPGEKGIIKVYYEVRDLGEFNEEINISTNLDEQPQVVKLKGTCISVQECFPDINNMNVRNISVINKSTQAPVPLATLTFVRNHNTAKPATIPMDRMGKATEEIPIGLYNITANMAGYEPYASEIFVPKSLPSLLVELTPITALKKEEAVTPLEVAPAKDSVVVTSTDLPENKYAANNIILLLDVSASMRSEKKFSLLQQSINNLALVLRPIDYVTIITYASDAKTVLKGCTGDNKEKITSTVQELVPSGSTQGVKGLNTAYDVAMQQFINAGNNQIILATDGEFSEKGVKDEYYEQLISGYAAKGIKLSILGFGVNQLAIERMKKMVTSGKGSFIHIDSEKFVKDVLIDEIKKMSVIKGGE